MHHRSSRLGVIAFTLCGLLTLLHADTAKTGAPPDDWSGLKAVAKMIPIHFNH